MPIEREFKYVLHDPDLNLLRFVNFGHRFVSYEILQAYLDDGCRIRRSTTKEGKPEYFFTYKKKVGEDLIEVEMEISEFDFDKLLSVSNRRLTKTRFELADGENCVWAFDYFWEPVEGDGPYFVMAEFETKYDIRTAPEIIYFAKDFLLHVDDGRFNLTSHALTDIQHAKKIMLELLENC